jgi:hypothetical protein
MNAHTVSHCSVWWEWQERCVSPQICQVWVNVGAILADNHNEGFGESISTSCAGGGDFDQASKEIVSSLTRHME